MRTLKLTFVVGAVAAVAAAVTGMSALATAPGKNGQIAFHRFYGRSGVTAGIFVINPDGTVASPGWSPDGKQIAFARAPFRSGSGDLTPRSSAIYVVSASGKGMRRITPPSLNGGDRPDFSPDGTLILFHSLPKSGDLGGEYYTVHPDGSGLTQLTH